MKKLLVSMLIALSLIVAPTFAMAEDGDDTDNECHNCGPGGGDEHDGEDGGGSGGGGSDPGEGAGF